MDKLRLQDTISFYRKKQGLTQEELARMLGVTNQSVSKWEMAGCYPDITLIPKLAEIFEISIDELVAAELIEKADSRLTKAELAPLLQKLYARIASDKELNFEDVMDEARGIADKINEDVRQRKFQDPYKKEIRDYLRKNRILIKDKKY